ncbi:MAG: helix-turn-helix transcriptional regulator [Sideroxydans sp.]|nr:helix-turn-helix transcriptional regulator [Sideroxydans sp.]
MVTKKSPREMKDAETILKGKGLPSPDDAIGTRIYEKRVERQLNVSQLAERTKEVSNDGKGLSRAVIAGYENGSYKPGTRELRILCSALDVSPNWLVFGRERLTEQPSQLEIFTDEALPELGIAKLVYILTSLQEEDFNAVATVLLSLAKQDKAIKAGLAKEADVMGRMIVASRALESSKRWANYIDDHFKKGRSKDKSK